MSAPAIKTSLTVTNFTDDKLEAMLALFRTYMNGIQCYKGIRTIGDTQTALPCVMVQPTKDDQRMITTGKTDVHYSYDIAWYAGAGDPATACKQLTDVGNILEKLFSNNALGDISTAATNRFKTYTDDAGTVQWSDSEITPVEYSPSFQLDGTTEKPRYSGIGFMRIVLETVAVK